MGTINTSDDTFWAEQGLGDSLDYTLDWSQLGAPLASSAWSGAAGVTVTNQATVASLSTCFLAGASADTWYEVTNSVVTTDDWSRTSRCKPRRRGRHTPTRPQPEHSCSLHSPIRP